MKQALLCGFVAMVIGIALTRVLILVLGRIKMKQVIREQGPEAHKKKSGTLTMGGVGFFLAVPIALAATGTLMSRNVLVALSVASVCFFIGFADDFAKFKGKKTEGIKARYKIVIELALGGALGWYVLQYIAAPTVLVLPVGWPQIALGVLFIPFVVFVFSGTLNAVNFTDGLDGLLGGCTIIVCGAYSIYLARVGTPEDIALISLLCAIGGVVAGFLWFNAHPASLFMGDTGSLYIGGLLGAVAVLTRTEIFFAVAGLLLVAEVMSVVLQVASFRLTKKRIFKMSPIHHHFELSGWAETQVVSRFWIITAICSAAALLIFTR